MMINLWYKFEHLHDKTNWWLWGNWDFLAYRGLGFSLQFEYSAFFINQVGNVSLSKVVVNLETSFYCLCFHTRLFLTIGAFAHKSKFLSFYVFTFCIYHFHLSFSWLYSFFPLSLNHLNFYNLTFLG